MIGFNFTVNHTMSMIKQQHKTNKNNKEEEINNPYVSIPCIQSLFINTNATKNTPTTQVCAYDLVLLHTYINEESERDCTPI